jgi:hypothetical protein
MDKDRRHPTRQFDAALVASYLQGRKIESVQLMALGKSNTNYRLILTDGEAACSDSTTLVPTPNARTISCIS